MIDYESHWNEVYSNSELNRLGWYEENPQPSLELINSCNLPKDALILDVGSGASTLIGNLLQESYTNIIATDISKVALERAKTLLTEEEANSIEWIVDDITNPEFLAKHSDINLWHDRTVLHFLTTEELRKGYLTSLNSLLKDGGFVIIAVFSLEGSKKCSGLDVKNYDHIMIEKFLGSNFKLQNHFPYMYKMPSGEFRPYIYTLFQKIL